MRHLSTKELNYINDIMSWELLSSKKCYQYASQENNSPHKQVFLDAAKTHQENYNNMLNYLGQMNKEQGGQLH